MIFYFLLKLSLKKFHNSNFLKNAILEIVYTYFVDFNLVLIPTPKKPYISYYSDNRKVDPQKQLHWEDLSKKIRTSRNYWISTTFKSRPHLVPIWGIWYDYKFYFSTSQISKKAKNLYKNAYCVISTEDANHPVIIEGIAAQEHAFNTLEHIVELYNEKYQWKFSVSSQGIFDDLGNGGPIFIVRPLKVLAWESFPKSFTVWSFSETSDSV